jgi:hypothetical protein
MGRLVRNDGATGMMEVFAAQPYTRSITPRYGSTARSGSRLFEKEEIVSSGPEARWASSNAHRPGAVPAVPNCTATARERDTGYVWCGAGRASAWLSKTECHSARGRSVAAKAPRSGIERFAGAWIARWLQKSVRSISSAVLVGGRKAHGQPLTSAARRPLPRRGSETDSRRAQGCGTKRAILTSVRGAPLGESRASNRRKAPRTTTASP